MKLINLIRNESLKLSRSISTWIMVGVLIIIVVVAGIVIKNQNAQSSNQNWKSQLINTNNELKQSATQPGFRKEASSSINQTIQVNDYCIDHNIPPINSDTLWGFVEGNKSIIALISLFAVIMGGGIVANEFSDGTIKLLLIRPARRWKILLAKYITVLVYTLIFLVILFIFSFILGGVLFSFQGVNLPYLNYSNGIITEQNMVSHTLGVYGLECINLIMMVSLAFMISTVFRSSSLAIGAGVFLMYAGSILTRVFSSYNWSKYILFSNTDLNQYISGSPPVQGMTMTFSIVVLIVYFVVFNVISFLGFIKRDVTA